MSVPAALNLLPFGSALVAIRADSRRSAAWVAVVANALWALLFIGIALIVLVGLGGTLIAVPLALIVAVPCALNALSLWGLLRARGA